MTFSQILKAHRKRLGLRQKQMPDILGVSWRTFQTWESGASVPHLVTQEGCLARLSNLHPDKKADK